MTEERPKAIMTAFWVRTADTRDALEIVATGAKPLAQLLDTLKAIPAVGRGVLLIVVLAEIGGNARSRLSNRCRQRVSFEQVTGSLYSGTFMRGQRFLRVTVVSDCRAEY